MMEKANRIKQLLTIGLAVVLVASSLFVSMPVDVFADEPLIESEQNLQVKSQEKSEEKLQVKLQEKSEEKSQEKTQHSINETVKDGGYEVSVKADPGVYPSDARVTVSRITKRIDIENAIAKEDENAEVVVAFDI